MSRWGIRVDVFGSWSFSEVTGCPSSVWHIHSVRTRTWSILQGWCCVFVSMRYCCYDKVSGHESCVVSSLHCGNVTTTLVSKVVAFWEKLKTNHKTDNNVGQTDTTNLWPQITQPCLSDKIKKRRCSGHERRGTTKRSQVSHRKVHVPSSTWAITNIPGFNCQPWALTNAKFK